jgi:hypothetical protein
VTRPTQAQQCVDPFRLVALANEAINKARRWAWNLEREKAKNAPPRRPGRPLADSPPPRDQARWVKHTRWALLKAPDALKPAQLEVLHQLRRGNSVLYRCWQLKEGLRDLYRLADPPTHRLTWTGGWPGPAAAGSARSSPCPRPCGQRGTGSWQRSSSGSATPSWKA